MTGVPVQLLCAIAYTDSPAVGVPMLTVTTATRLMAGATVPLAMMAPLPGVLRSRVCRFERHPALTL